MIQHQVCCFPDDDEKNITRFTLQQNFPAKTSVCISSSSLQLSYNVAPHTGRAQSGRSTQTGTQTTENQSLAEIRSPWEPSLDQNSAFTQVLRSTPTSPPWRPSLCLPLAFLHLHPPLIKSLNWLIHTCSCTGSFGTNLHHQSRFSHQLRVHPSAHCPSLIYRAKQWSPTVCGWICVCLNVWMHTWNKRGCS